MSAENLRVQIGRSGVSIDRSEVSIEAGSVSATPEPVLQPVENEGFRQIHWKNGHSTPTQPSPPRGSPGFEVRAGLARSEYPGFASHKIIFLSAPNEERAGVRSRFQNMPDYFPAFIRRGFNFFCFASFSVRTIGTPLAVWAF